MFCHFKYCPLSNKVDTLENRFIAAVYELCVSQVLSTVLRAVCEYFPCHKIGGMREPARELPGTGQVPTDPTYSGNTLQLMVPTSVNLRRN